MHQRNCENLIHSDWKINRNDIPWDEVRVAIRTLKSIGLFVVQDRQQLWAFDHWVDETYEVVDHAVMNYVLDHPSTTNQRLDKRRAKMATHLTDVCVRKRLPACREYAELEIK